MKQNRLRVSALAGMLVGALSSGTARAQTTPAVPDAAQTAGDAATKAKSKPKVAKPRIKTLPSVAIVVTNSRTVGLTELDAALSGGADSMKIAGPLAAGKKVVVHVAHDKACLFDLHGSYDDQTTTEMQDVNLCNEKKINLVE